MKPPWKNLESGIRLTLLEMRDFRQEMREFRQELLKFHQEAAQDRKQAAEDRKQFLEYCRRAEEDRRELQKLIRVIAGVGVKILKTRQEHTRYLKGIDQVLRSNTRILQGIHKLLRASGNSRNGPRR